MYFNHQINSSIHPFTFQDLADLAQHSVFETLSRHSDSRDLHQRVYNGPLMETDFLSNTITHFICCSSLGHRLAREWGWMRRTKKKREITDTRLPLSHHTPLSFIPLSAKSRDHGQPEINYAQLSDRRSRDGIFGLNANSLTQIVGQLKWLISLLEVMCEIIIQAKKGSLHEPAQCYHFNDLVQRNGCGIWSVFWSFY